MPACGCPGAAGSRPPLRRAFPPPPPRSRRRCAACGSGPGTRPLCGCCDGSRGAGARHEVKRRAPAARCPLPARLQPRHLGAAGERSGGGPRWDSGHGLPAWRRGLPGGARGSGKQPGAHPRAAAAGPLGAGVQPAGPPAAASSVGVRREAPLAWRRGAGRSHRQSPARPAPGWRPEGDSRDMGGKVPGASGHYRAISVLQTA